MNYKAEFQKQEILCPETGQWVDLTLELNLKMIQMPPKEARVADQSVQILDDINFQNFGVELYLYENLNFFINDNYLAITDLMPEAQHKVMQNMASLLQAMGKELFNSFTFGYYN
ncbi:hypothetical protein IMG5_146620 [Ichthyophthirius multifiliis]|uniref:Uncharacterized protein n=1 Tax=Ichthyophthirius multifiliis TaxID=5932 RepID=G0QY20_ICHMU|nr:hypothetical protein IMG5_146620 [Ichthyophthirius multifiliis]EGR29889.1 hypothetical protein IMG5_146620 [Ichthyophthirius multifiliis]|eukprot:XP_004031125.1 hypothetical protein IMG5_146620 [Ichthyophthirius multifiliis]